MSLVRGLATVIGSALLAVAAACSSFTAADPDGAPDASADAQDDVVSSLDGEAPPPGTLVLATGMRGLTSVTTDGTNVYFTEATECRLRVVPLEGGAVSMPEDTRSPGTPRGLVISGGSAFWIDETWQELRSWAGAATVVRSTSALTPPPFALAGGAGLLFTLARESEEDPVSLQMRAISAPERVGSSQPVGPSAFDVAAAGDFVYFTQPGERSVVSVPIAGMQLGARKVVATDQPECAYIAATPAAVVWTDGVRVVEASFEAAKFGDPRQLAKETSTVVALAADGDDRWWVTADGTLHHLGPGMVTARTVGAPFSAVPGHSLAVTSKYAVVLTTDGRVLRIAK